MTTILIVEDDDAIRNNITRLLKLEGFDIVSATNGREGLDRLRQVPADVVISDVSMPGMDGFELLEAIRADRTLAALPVMLLTALDDRASMRRGMTAGPGASLRGWRGSALAGFTLVSVIVAVVLKDTEAISTALAVVPPPYMTKSAIPDIRPEAPMASTVRRPR